MGRSKNWSLMGVGVYPRARLHWAPMDNPYCNAMRAIPFSTMFRHTYKTLVPVLHPAWSEFGHPRLALPPDLDQSSQGRPLARR